MSLLVAKVPVYGFLVYHGLNRGSYMSAHVLLNLLS